MKSEHTGGSEMTIEVIKIVKDSKGNELYRIIKEDGKLYKTYKKKVKMQKDILEDLFKTPHDVEIDEMVKRKVNREVTIKRTLKKGGQINE